MILPVLFAQPAPLDDANVNLDDERLQDELPKGLQKVELDLDDALFLEFEEEQPPQEEDQSVPAAPPAESVAMEEDQKRSQAPPIWKKLSVVAIALVVMIALAAGVLWFLKPKPQPHAKATPPTSTASTPTPHVPEPSSLSTREPKTETLSRRTYVFDPFVVEYAQGERSYLLAYQIYVPGVPSSLSREMEAKTAMLRDEVFRYLKNSAPGVPANPENEKKFKSDLLAVINKGLQNGQASEILVEGRVVK